MDASGIFGMLTGAPQQPKYDTSKKKMQYLVKQMQLVHEGISKGRRIFLQWNQEHDTYEFTVRDKPSSIFGRIWQAFIRMWADPHLQSTTQKFSCNIEAILTDEKISVKDRMKFRRQVAGPMEKTIELFSRRMNGLYRTNFKLDANSIPNLYNGFHTVEDCDLFRPNPQMMDVSINTHEDAIQCRHLRFSSFTQGIFSIDRHYLEDLAQAHGGIKKGDRLTVTVMKKSGSQDEIFKAEHIITKKAPQDIFLRNLPGSRENLTFKVTLKRRSAELVENSYDFYTPYLYTHFQLKKHETGLESKKLPIPLQIVPDLKPEESLDSLSLDQHHVDMTYSKNAKKLKHSVKKRGRKKGFLVLDNRSNHIAVVHTQLGPKKQNSYPSVGRLSHLHAQTVNPRSIESLSTKDIIQAYFQKKRISRKDYDTVKYQTLYVSVFTDKLRSQQHL